MSLPQSINKKVTYYAWVIWFVASSFYAIEFLQRVSPSIMAISLMQSFNIGPGTLSFIASLYFYAYAVAQIPVGIMLDRYGARRLLTFACALISVSSILFAVAKSLLVLAIARILIGFASAFAFLGVLKLAGAWFPERRYPLMVGLTNTLGVVGAIMGEAPLAKLLQFFGWRESMMILALAGSIITVCIWFIIKDNPTYLTAQPCVHKPLAKVTPRDIFKDLRKVLSCPQIWLTAIYAGCMVAPVIALGELWAVSFIADRYHFSSVLSAAINSAIFIGIACGGPVNGWVASYIQEKKRVMFIGNFMALVCLLLVIFGQQFGAPVLFSLLFLFGFGTSSMLIAFTLNKGRCDAQHSATITAFTNIMIVMGGSIFQDILGILLHHFEKREGLDYTAAFTVIPMLSCLCLGLLFFIKSPPRAI